MLVVKTVDQAKKGGRRRGPRDGKKMNDRQGDSNGVCAILTLAHSQIDKVCLPNVTNFCLSLSLCQKITFTHADTHTYMHTRRSHPPHHRNSPLPTTRRSYFSLVLFLCVNRHGTHTPIRKVSTVKLDCPEGL